jgi:hypothetical protein
MRIFSFSEAGFASAWSADILVRSVPGLNTEADKNVRAPKNRRCAHPKRELLCGVVLAFRRA